MKKGFNTVLLTIVLSLITLSCSTDDNDDLIDNAALIAQTEDIAESGTWRITDFNDSGVDETSDFTGYDFTFASDGTLTASNSTNTLEGTWSITNDDSDSNDDDSNDDDDDIDFNLFFPVSDANNFEDLNDDWDIVSTSATKIELIDISGGDGDIDTLTFERN